jgi:hypothetical protein
LSKYESELKKFKVEREGLMEIAGANDAIADREMGYGERFHNRYNI